MTTHDKKIDMEAYEVSFDEATRQYLDEIELAKLRAMAEAAKPYDTQKDTVAILFIRQRKLSGEWRRKQDNSGIERTDSPLPIPTLPPPSEMVRKPRRKK